VLTRPYLIGATEVTISQFAKFVDAARYVTEAEKLGGGTWPDNSTPDPKLTWKAPGYAVTGNSPVTEVTWNDCAQFCNWLSQQEKLQPCYVEEAGQVWAIDDGSNGYRLPTEAEWEFACRAGSATHFSFGDDPRLLGDHAWYSELVRSRWGPAHDVATKSANAFGLFDMHGNVHEWCQDWFDAKWYAAASGDDPHGPPTGSIRASRGGSWRTSAFFTRSAYRGGGRPSGAVNHLGFRVVRQLPLPARADASAP
jgi:formylglycine-generating enzyme required for sulfatase activity